MHLVDIWFELPIIHVMRVDTRMHEEVHNIHEQLLRGVGRYGASLGGTKTS
jgi:hypothetical protein